MSVETVKDSVCISKIIDQKNESVIVEADSIIPDVKPDILSAISTSGTVCIYKKEILDGRIRIDGSIETYIMYLADDENSSVRSMSSNLDFSQTIDMPKAKVDMQLDTNISLKNIECRVVNGRKISLRAILDIEARISLNENVDIVNSVNVTDVQTLSKSLNINSMIGSGTTKVYAKDTFTIDNIDNIAEIMKVDAKIINKDTKISYNKVLAKSDLSVRILYLTEDNRINSIENTIPVMGFIDIPDITEENICSVKYEIKNMIIKPNSVEEHSIYVEVEIGIMCSVYKNQEITLIQDLYSPSRQLVFTQKQIKVMGAKEKSESTCNIRETQAIPEIQGNKIYDVGINVDITNQKVQNNRIMYEGELKLNFIYASSTAKLIDTKMITIPFTHTMDFAGINASSNIETMIEISNQDFVVTSDSSVDIKIDLQFTASSSKNADINIIDDIKEDETRQIKTYSMVIYFVKSGDSLWKIAKKFGSTVERIVMVNSVEDENKLDVGQQLFIPRYHG